MVSANSTPSAKIKSKINLPLLLTEWRAVQGMHHRRHMLDLPRGNIIALDATYGGLSAGLTHLPHIPRHQVYNLPDICALFSVVLFIDDTRKVYSLEGFVVYRRHKLSLYTCCCATAEPKMLQVGFSLRDNCRMVSTQCDMGELSGRRRTLRTVHANARKANMYAWARRSGVGSDIASRIRL